MAIPIGKLALYTAASGIHPALTLPVSLDVGTDNPALLADPLYLGYRAPRLRGPEYDALVEAFVEGVAEVWPGCVIQWEDFKQANALRILDRYRDRVPSFNDDIQGTAAVVLAGILAGLRSLGMGLRDTRVVLVGAGAAGIGIARLIRLAMLDDGMDEPAIRRALVLVDSRGGVHDRREDLDATKRELALPAEAYAGYGFSTEFPALVETIERVRPTVLVGTTGVGGTFGGAGPPRDGGCDRAADRPAALQPDLGGRGRRPSTSCAGPTAGPSSPRARRSTRSTSTGTRHEVGQANNVFIFPGLGLGAIAAEAAAITDRMFLLAARTLADAVTAERLATGAIYPPVGALREVTRAIALEVAGEAVRAGVAGISPADDLEATVDGAMWWPAYVPYLPARPVERRRAAET